MSKSISSAASDTAKIFSSYSVPINWYQDEYHSGDDELRLNIRKFINKRIDYAFRDEVINVNQSDPWHSLVEDPFDGSQESTKSSFKYILDHTFFRPRDLLLFFKPLSQHKYNFPLSKTDVNHLIGRYCEEVVNEIKNEFSCFYTSEQIATIFNAFGEISSELKSPQKRSITYQDAISIIDRNCKGVSADDLLEDMFYRSLIGGMGDNGYVYFKHREPTTDVYEFNKSHGVIIHSALRVYCSNKGYV
ncbi:P-loop ATPase, Sll1717 family [Shewanella mangrovisoli]|uniref:P-loop ATPase, Sll1717 family n=1 Tax=Shewanella mangrovisoli TaxID=2864211 RepID=UPI0035B74801